MSTIRLEADFDADPQAVFDALMDEEQHAAFSGQEAVIDWREGGRFLTFGERHFGYTLVLVPGRKIVQAWAHRDWPAHTYSIVTTELEPTPSGTHLSLTQVGAPEGSEGGLTEAWKQGYFEPLRKYLRDAESAA